MVQFFQDVLDRKAGLAQSIIVEDDLPAAFPFARWQSQYVKYQDYWNSFTGTWLTETLGDAKDEKGAPVLRYPLQINHLQTVCFIHSYVLFGEVKDNPLPLAPLRVSPRLIPGKKKFDEDAKRKAQELEDFVNRVWMDNAGRALQQEAGLIQTFLGGIVFKVSWQPDNEDLEYGIRLEQVLPDFFCPIWDSGQPDNLLEVFVVYRIPPREAALKFGHNDDPGSNGVSGPVYVEHWTKDEVTITLDRKPIEYTIGGETFVYDKMPNPYGFIPYVYIPRERAGSYFGLSAIDGLIESSREMNARLADNSDIIEEISHRERYATNLSVTPKPIDLGGSRPGVNLGVTPPGGETPAVWAIDPPPLNDAMVQHPEMLRNQFSRDSFVPSVAYGEDEGSQRSALTLAFRMYPLTSKMRAVRTNWTTGLVNLAKKIAKIAIMKGIGGITKKHLEGMDLSINWSPMIPRDREADLNEAVLAAQTNMIDPMEANKLLGISDDPGRAAEDVRQWMLFLSSLNPAEKDTGKVPTTTKTQKISTITKDNNE